MSFLPLDRDSNINLPLTYNQIVPDSHLAKFVVLMVSFFDLLPFEQKYKGHGKPAYSPSMMLSLILYSYITGITSARSMETMIVESLPLLYICGGMRPHHSTISKFRRRFLSEIDDLFVQVLKFANKYGLIGLENCYLDGTKMKANASKHHAYSFNRALDIKATLEKELNELEERQNGIGGSDYTSVNIPEEIKRRQKKLANVNIAIERIINKAHEHYQAELEAYNEKMDARSKKILETGKNPRGKVPSPPTEGPGARDQTNLTDPDSRIMPNSDKGFSQAYNAQAVVEGHNMLIVAAYVSQNPNDKKEMVPALVELAKNPDSLGTVKNIGADNGYFSETNSEACEKAGINPFIAVGRTPHHKSLNERLSPQTPLPLTEKATPVEKMAYKLKTEEGKKIYAQRKQTVEPAFGIIKAVMNIRQFMLRGIKKVNSEWKLICMCYNIKKIFLALQKVGQN
ncbi:MAG: transposase [Deltaproteobacteria bacterium]|jgi:transposase|nr:transposase [Deltaproteobacteria bacterium]